MNSRTIINNELQSIAPGLVLPTAHMPYTLPPGYFENFSTDMLRLLNSDGSFRLSGNILLPRTMPYSVPPGYFNQFAETVFQKIYAFFKQSYTDHPVLENFSKTMLYSVPEGYFASFAQTTLDTIKAGNQQNVPAGYFENLPDILLTKVRRLDARKELDEVAPLLNTISRQPVQQVPAGYFEHLKAPMVAEQHTAPVIQVKKKTSWLKYAAAACVAAMLSLGAYKYYDNKTPAPSIANQPSMNAIDNQLADVDVATIEHYLQNNSSSLESHTTHYDNIQADDINDLLLEDFSDQQLKKSLEETPEFPTLNKKEKI